MLAILHITAEFFDNFSWTDWNPFDVAQNLASFYIYRKLFDAG